MHAEREREGERERETDRQTEKHTAVLLLQIFFICASVVSYLTFVLSLYIPNLSFFWCLGRAVLRDRDTVELSGLNTDGTFTMAYSNSFLSP